MRERARREQHSTMPGWSGKTLDKVDSRSTAQTDTFAGAKVEEKASVCFGRNDRFAAYSAWVNI
jgi:hypothetical protein